MKKLLTNIFSIITNLRFIAMALTVLLLGAGVWWYNGYALGEFTKSYSIYREKADIQRNAAFIPGAAQNPLRGELNLTLVRVLASGTNAKDRVELAHHGLDLIIESNTEIDAIGNAAIAVEAAVDEMERAAHNPGNIFRKAAMLAIVAGAKQELYTIQDIRGLSYRANFETAEVFNRLITDNGALTEAYIKDLNTQLPAAEIAFNKRQNDYVALEGEIYDTSRAYAKLVGSE